MAFVEFYNSYSSASYDECLSSLALSSFTGAAGLPLISLSLRSFFVFLSSTVINSANSSPYCAWIKCELFITSINLQENYAAFLHSKKKTNTRTSQPEFSHVWKVFQHFLSQVTQNMEKWQISSVYDKKTPTPSFRKIFMKQIISAKRAQTRHWMEHWNQ